MTTARAGVSSGEKPVGSLSAPSNPGNREDGSTAKHVEPPGSDNGDHDRPPTQDPEKSRPRAGSESGSDPEAGPSDPDSEPDGEETEQRPAARPQSRRASSVRSRLRAVIPPSNQRGLLARFTLIPELEQPYNYANKTKWYLTLVVALAGGVAPLGSAIFYPALGQMAIDLNTTTTIANLAVALYMLAMSIFPLWWSSFSETLGRRNIYLTSFALFIVFATLSAVSHNIAMLIVMRLLTGGASASVQAVGAGTIADLWEPAERGRAMSIFYLGPLIGPLAGPILGGILAEAFGWKATMWALVIYGGVILILLVFCLPETKHREALENNRARVLASSSQPGAGTEGSGLARTRTAESVKDTTKRAAKIFKQFILDPLSVLAFLRFPPVLITVYYAAITFGSLFAVNVSLQAAYSTDPYNFNQLIVGLLYIPSGLGYILTAIFGGKWLDRIMVRQAEKAGRYDEHGKLILLPEDRMQENAWVAGTLYPASLLIYGWTIQAGVFWFVPLIGTFLFGVSSMLVFAAATTMLTEFMPKRSSSGVAVNNFVRNIFSCVGTIAAQPVIDAIGDGWLFTILGLFTWITGYLCIWILKKKAPKWRIAMDKALNE